MLLNDIPYFVKFTFASNNSEDCYSLVSKENLNFVKHSKTKEQVGFLRIGELISIEVDEGIYKNYKITDISIEQLVDDIKILNYGLDPHCDPAVLDKEWLFKILVAIDSVDWKIQLLQKLKNSCAGGIAVCCQG